jgi:membrane-associated phospholipid phosphatase
MRFRLGLVVALSLAVVVFSRLVAMGSLRPLDQVTAAAFQRIWWQPLFPLFEGIAITGGIELTSLLAVGLFIFMLWRGTPREASAMLAFPIGILIETISKHFVYHPGPLLTRAGQLSVTTFIPGQANSYPSGHMVRSVIVYGLIALVVHRQTPPGWGQRLVVPLATILVAAIAFDRLYLAVHWGSDVVGGLLLGGLSLAAAIAFINPRHGADSR